MDNFRGLAADPPAPAPAAADGDGGSGAAPLAAAAGGAPPAAVPAPGGGESRGGGGDGRGGADGAAGSPRTALGAGGNLPQRDAAGRAAPPRQGGWFWRPTLPTLGLGSWFSNPFSRSMPGPQILSAGDKLFRRLQPNAPRRKYTVERLLGSGRFAEVYSASYSAAAGLERAALKVSRPGPTTELWSHTDIAGDEAARMREITSWDPDDFFAYAKFIDYFSYRCSSGRYSGQEVDIIVMHRYGLDLRQFQAGGHQLELPQLARVGYDLCSAFGFLNERGWVYSALKMEDVVFRHGGAWPADCDLTRTVVVLIDCGDGPRILEQVPRGATVGTRAYRAPELLYGMEWDFGIDVWATGILLVELRTGKAFFDSQNNVMHAQQVDEVFGTPDVFRGQEPVECHDCRADYIPGAKRGQTRKAAAARRYSADIAAGLERDSTVFWTFVRMLLRPDPRARPSAHQVCTGQEIADLWPDVEAARRARASKMEEYVQNPR
eukprot:TRINITY_DN16069_c0_g1_i1.p1 TRINITY_DN16069_c0_g1~~TRINITY_DN16069_c0_g1_i1.p1  ORF type:complete len:492 (+),score=64.10 TRINITY_DN16069_c0_g1_i1:116-1591(+)